MFSLAPMFLTVCHHSTILWKVQVMCELFIALYINILIKMSNDKNIHFVSFVSEANLMLRLYKLFVQLQVLPLVIPSTCY